MGKTVATRVDATLRNGRIHVPWRALATIAMIVVCSSLVHVGVPRPDVSTNQISPRTYVARVGFRYIDPGETEKRKKQARAGALSVYEINPEWKNQTLRTIDMVFEAVESPDTLALGDATGKLRAKGVEVDPAPVWRAVRQRGLTRLRCSPRSCTPSIRSAMTASSRTSGWTRNSRPAAAASSARSLRAMCAK
jgi:membrane-associated HD superfamily phosphohydrolase